MLFRSLTAHVDSSSGAPYSVAFLIAGSAPAQVPLRSGATLLALPEAMVAIVVFHGGFDFIERLDYDAALAGAALYAQVAQFDAAAAGGVSFTPGLELHLGF